MTIRSEVVAGVREQGTVASASPSSPRFRFDPRYLAPLFITTILLAAHLNYGALKSPLHTGIAIGAAILTEVLFGWFLTRKIPHLASAYVSGISAGILTRTEILWPFGLTGALAVASKYVLRWRGKHLWNPTNFSITAMLALAPGQMATLMADFGNNDFPVILLFLWGGSVIYRLARRKLELWPALGAAVAGALVLGAPWLRYIASGLTPSSGSYVLILCLGCYIVSRLRRLHICETYVAAFCLFAVLRFGLTGIPLAASISPITGPMYMLFTFFMITDPKTTVENKVGQGLVAFLVAAAEFILRLNQDIHAPYHALFIVGPIANVIELWWKGRGAPSAQAARSTAKAAA